MKVVEILENEHKLIRDFNNIQWIALSIKTGPEAT